MELPFLYATRTILGPSRTTLRSTRRFSCPKSRIRCLHQPARDDTTDQTSFFRQKAEAVAAKQGPRVSNTITREESRAFDRLRRLAGQVQKSRPSTDTPSDTNLLSVDPHQILTLFTPSSTALREHDAEINHICEDYMTSVSNEFKEALQSDPTQGDLGIWTVLRRRVFPLLALLKSQTEVSKDERKAAITALPVAKSLFQDNPPKASSKPDETTTSDESINTTPTASDAHAPPLISSLPILTRIYPSSLLLALRLLTRHHPLSTLTPSLLQHIRSLGSSSYILGTNTHFYNTLLLLRWNTHSSLREVCSLLSEMERGAVEFDRGTVRVLRDVADERWSDLMQHSSHVDPEFESVGDGKVVSRGANWWERQEQVQWWPRIEKWRNIIAKRLEEKGMGEVFREGPSTSPGAGWETKQKMPEVLL